MTKSSSQGGLESRGSNIPPIEPDSRLSFEFTVEGGSGETVEIRVVACPHDSDEDAEYLIMLLSLEQDSSNATLFIEEGSPMQEDGYIRKLQDLITNNPRISEVVANNARDRQQFDQIFAHFSSFNGPFSSASAYWESKGNKVVNMDLVGDYSMEAAEFITQASSLEYAVEWMYYATFGDEVSQEVELEILKVIFPDMEAEHLGDLLKELDGAYRDSLRKVRRIKEAREKNDSLRELYMRGRIVNEAKSGDIVLAHPNHVRRLLNLLDS